MKLFRKLPKKPKKTSFQRLSRNRKYEPYLVKPVISTISENDWHSFVLLLVLNMSKLMMYGIKVLKTVITGAHSNAKILKGTLKVTASSVINHKILHPSLKISLILERFGTIFRIAILSCTYQKRR